MTDQVLNILKFVLLGLLYLFFARVLWAVWSEVRTPVRRQQIIHPQGTPGQAVPPASATTPMARPADDPRSSKRAKKKAKRNNCLPNAPADTKRRMAPRFHSIWVCD